MILEFDISQDQGIVETSRTMNGISEKKVYDKKYFDKRFRFPHSRVRYSFFVETSFSFSQLV